MAPEQRSRMKDVARIAGVSLGTVDRVLHHRGRVARETAQRVREAAATLRFSPNEAASRLSRAQVHVVAAVLPLVEQDGGYWRQVVRGIERGQSELASHYLDVEYLHYDRFDAGSLERLIPRLIHQEPAGIILAPTIPEPSRNLMARVPDHAVVLIDGDLPGTAPLTVIAQDSLESGVLAAKLLDLAAPRRRFLSITVGPDDHHLRVRRQGFVQYFAHRGNEPPERLDHHQILTESHWDELVHLFESSHPPEGIFITNAAAHQVVDHLPQGYHPRIAGYDLIPENIRCLQDGSIMAVVNQQPENQGYQALYAIHRQRILHEPPADRIRIPIDLIVRENLPFHWDARKDAPHGLRIADITEKTEAKGAQR